MATEPVLAAFQLTALQRHHFVRSRDLSDYWELTKPEVNFLIAMTTVAAFCLGSPKPFVHFPWFLLLNTLFGTVLVASGAGALNQLIERKFDAQMRRTSRRPIAAGRVEPGRGLVPLGRPRSDGEMCAAFAHRISARSTDSEHRRRWQPGLCRTGCLEEGTMGNARKA